MSYASGQETDLPTPHYKRLVRHLKEVDAFPKLEEEYRITTDSGVALSVVSGIVMLLLFFSQLRAFFGSTTTEHIVVDTRPASKITINFNITFPSLRCSECVIDLMDVSGSQLTAESDTFRTRLDSQGRAIGSPFLVSRHNDLDLSSLDKPGEGCIVTGSAKVNKVAGNMHIALGASHHHRQGKHVHQFAPSQVLYYNASHVINHLSFGPAFPGRPNPLDGVIKRTEKGPAHFQYFIKIVPTQYEEESAGEIGESIETFQFSVTEHTRHIAIHNGRIDTRQLPGVFFIYEISPFMVRVVKTHGMPFSSFLTSLCAIIGGVFTVSGLVSSVLYHGNRAIRRRKERKEGQNPLSPLAHLHKAAPT